MIIEKLIFPEVIEKYYTEHPEGLTLIEAMMDWATKVNIMVEHLNLTDAQVEQLFTHTLPENVENVLNAWYENGHLANVINVQFLDGLEKRTKWKSITEFGAVGDGVADDTQAFVAAVASNERKILVPDGSYRVTSSVYLRSDFALFGIGNPTIFGDGVQEIFKTDNQFTYNNIKMVNVGLDSNKIPADNNLRICAQFYNVRNLQVEKSRFKNASAGIGVDNCKDVWIDNKNVFEGMFQQKMNAAQFPGSYGYGVVVNESDNVWVKGNIIGNIGENKQVDRHAVYISNKNAPSPVIVKNSANVFVHDNSIKMNIYASDAEMVTGFEYPLKSIGGAYVEFKDNIITGGAGGALLNVNYINGGHVKIRNNKFIDVLKVGVLVVSDPAPSAYYFDRIEVEDNFFRLTGEYAHGIKAMNYKEMNVRGNTFISTIADVAKKNHCYYLQRTSDNNGVQSTMFTANENNIRGFNSVGFINKVDSFVCDDIVEDFLTSGATWSPFTYVEAVSSKKTRIRFIKNVYKFKADTAAGLVGLSYTDPDFGYEITCQAVSPAKWISPSGDVVVATSATRPNNRTVQAGHKLWEQDLARFVYYTGFTWGLPNVAVAPFGTTAEILAIPAAQLNYSNQFIYNTTDKKPYWYDALAGKWKDAIGTILV